MNRQNRGWTRSEVERLIHLVNGREKTRRIAEIMERSPLAINNAKHTLLRLDELRLPDNPFKNTLVKWGKELKQLGIEVRRPGEENQVYYAPSAEMLAPKIASIKDQSITDPYTRLDQAFENLREAVESFIVTEVTIRTEDTIKEMQLKHEQEISDYKEVVERFKRSNLGESLKAKLLGR